MAETTSIPPNIKNLIDNQPVVSLVEALRAMSLDAQVLEAIVLRASERFRNSNITNRLPIGMNADQARALYIYRDRPEVHTKPNEAKDAVAQGREGIKVLEPYAPFLRILMGACALFRRPAERDTTSAAPEEHDDTHAAIQRECTAQADAIIGKMKSRFAELKEGRVAGSAAAAAAASDCQGLATDAKSLVQAFRESPMGKELTNQLRVVFSQKPLDEQRATELLAAGGDPDGKHSLFPHRGEPLLSGAAEKGCARGVSLLVDAGANVNCKDEFGKSALIRAASGGHLLVVNLLIGANADLNEVDNGGATALGYAADGGFSGIAAALLDAGANENHENSLGDTPLHTAAMGNHANMALLLIHAGACTHKQNNDGQNPASVARNAGHLELARDIEESGAARDALLESADFVSIVWDAIVAVEPGPPPVLDLCSWPRFISKCVSSDAAATLHGRVAAAKADLFAGFFFLCTNKGRSLSRPSVMYPVRVAIRDCLVYPDMTRQQMQTLEPLLKLRAGALAVGNNDKPQDEPAKVSLSACSEDEVHAEKVVASDSYKEDKENAGAASNE